KRNEMIKMPGRPCEVARLGKCSDVQLVKDDLLPGAAAPATVAPHVDARIDDLARAVDALRLVTGRRVGESLAVDEVAISGAGPCTGSRRRAPAAVLASHRQKRVELQRAGRGFRRPKPKPDAERRQFGAKR